MLRFSRAAALAAGALVVVAPFAAASAATAAPGDSGALTTSAGTVAVGGTVTVSVDTTGVDPTQYCPESAEVIVSVGSSVGTGTGAADGRWSIDVVVPTTAGVYTVAATCSGYYSIGASYTSTAISVVEGGMGSSDPDIPAEGSLTSANQGTVVSLKSISGSTVVIGAGAENANKLIWGSIQSTPRWLGVAESDANGNVTFTLPADLEVGLHKIALQDSTGTLLGWVSIRQHADGSWGAVEELEATGGTVATPMIGAGILAVGVAGIVGTALYRRRTAVTAAE